VAQCDVADGQDHGLMKGMWPRTQQAGKRRSVEGDVNGGVPLEHVRERPHTAPIVDRDLGWRLPASVAKTGGARQRGLAAILGHLVERRERNVQGILLEDLAGCCVRIGDIARGRGLSELPQGFEAPVADDLLGGLGARAEDTVHPLVIAEDRAE
jgi:hypothetical protein